MLLFLLHITDFVGFGSFIVCFSSMGFLYLWIEDVGVVSISIFNSLCLCIGTEMLVFLHIMAFLLSLIFISPLFFRGFICLWIEDVGLFFFFNCFGDFVYCCVGTEMLGS